VKWTILDEANHVHTVEFDDEGKWHGMENVAHIYSDEDRAIIKYNLMRNLLREPKGGTWDKYIWAIRPHQDV
jgi:hypothetical protein